MRNEWPPLSAGEGSVSYNLPSQHPPPLPLPHPHHQSAYTHPHRQHSILSCQYLLNNTGVNQSSLQGIFKGFSWIQIPQHLAADVLKHVYLMFQHTNSLSTLHLCKINEMCEIVQVQACTTDDIQFDFGFCFFQWSLHILPGCALGFLPVILFPSTVQKHYICND